MQYLDFLNLDLQSYGIRKGSENTEEAPHPFQNYCLMTEADES